MSSRRTKGTKFANCSPCLTSWGRLCSNSWMRLLTIAFALFLSVSAWAQNIDAQKLDTLCHAIAHAEGFGVPHAIPTRYHNPGDLKSRPGLPLLEGQRKIGKAGHVVFVNDEAGWAALRAYVQKVVNGGSRHYVAHTTLAQLSRVYAQRWQPWLRIATKELGVPASTRLEDYLKSENSLDFFDQHCYTL